MVETFDLNDLVQRDGKYVRAFSVGEANAIGPFEYVRLIYAGLIGYLLFGETIDTWTLIGGAIIVGSTLFIARDEVRKP